MKKMGISINMNDSNDDDVDDDVKREFQFVK